VTLPRAFQQDRRRGRLRPLWALPAALAGVALAGVAWLAGDALWALLPDGTASPLHLLLRAGLAVALTVCGALACVFARARWQQWQVQRLAAERALRAGLRRMRAQFEAVGRVGQADTLLTGDLHALAREITEAAARAIGCERVNVWRFNADETKLHCIDLYEATPGRHSAGMVLREHEFRNEFEALKRLRYVDANDPLSDPRTTGYVESYVKPLGITAMLDTAIRVAGRNLGVICFEHVGRQHRWQPDEIAFAGQLADKFAFGLMNSWRIDTERSLRASEASLASAQSVAHVGSWELDIASQDLTWSAETFRIFGVDPDRFHPTPDSVLARLHPEDRAAALASYRAALTACSDYESEYRVLLDDGSARTIHERGRVYCEDGRALRCLGTVQDVTERKRAEQALAYRDRILHAVTIGTARLLEDESLEKGMPAALSILGDTLGVERVLVIEFSEQAPKPNLRYSWEAPEVDVSVASVGLAPEMVDPEILRRWTAPLLHGQPVVTHRRTLDGPLAALFDRLHNQSILLMPILVGGRLWGVIGIDACKAERDWTTVETETLAIFARVIGSLIQRDATRRSLESSEERFRAVSQTARDAILMVDAAGHIAFWNRAAERILGYTPEAAAARPIQEWLIPARYRGMVTQALAALAGGSGAGQVIELEVTACSGAEVPVELSVAAMNLAGTWYAVGILRDISERRRAQMKILEMVRSDELTGLANRRTFVEAVQKAIARARRSGEGFAVLYLDLDHFKDVNDVLGHPVGDALLRRVSDVLTRCVRGTDTVARFGGDEFAVLATEVEDPAGLAVLAEKLLVALHKPFRIEGDVIRTGASLGIAVYGPDSATADLLLSHADIALYRAKQEGRGVYRFFTDSMDVEVRERVRLAAELREAIARSTLHLVYQPQVEMASGRIVGLEALLRWKHPRLGVVPPDRFVAAAEASGQIAALGHWVLENACRQTRRWLDAGLAVPRMAVNVSALQFKAPAELERDLEATLAACGLEPALLELELTETALMETSLEHREILERIRDKGYRLAIDDFGTGYSSLDYLRKLPVDRIKIDRSFISKIGSDAGDATIVKAAINIAQDFGLTVIAEGVETKAQVELLGQWGCHEAQGYYFAEPMPAEAAARVLRDGAVRAVRPLAAAG